jgi:hypothetical protein
MKRALEYQGYTIREADEAKQAEGFRWWVDMSQVDARSEAECPHFYQLPAAKAFIRENLRNEHPTNDDDGGGS